MVAWFGTSSYVLVACYVAWSRPECANAQKQNAYRLSPKMSGAYGEPDWANPGASAKADVTADAGPTTTTASAAAASTPSPS